MNFFSHLNELKLRIFYCGFCFVFTFFIAYSNIDLFLFIITKFFQMDFIFINLFEGFYCFFFMSFFLTSYLSFFVALDSIFCFLKSALTKNEKNLLYFLIRGEYIIQFSAFFFLYEIFLPHLFVFLLSFEQDKGENFFNLSFQPRLLDYIFVFWSIFFLIFSFFHIPLILFFFIQFRFVNNDFFIKFRREFIVLFLVLGCFFSPPDLYTQILLAFPCFLFYEITIFVFLFLSNL